MGGGEKARQECDGLIANLMTKVICANSCNFTNTFYSEMLGSSKHLFMNGSSSFGDYDLVDDLMGSGGSRASGGFSEQWHPDVPPGAFTKLRKGGRENGFRVEAFCFQGGRKYQQNKSRTWVKVEFPQHIQ